MEDDGEISVLPPTAAGVTEGLDPASFDVEVFKDYILKLLPLVLGAETNDLESSLFSFPDTLEKCKRFASDAQTPVLYVFKEKEESEEDSTFCYHDMSCCD